MNSVLAGVIEDRQRIAAFPRKPREQFHALRGRLGQLAPRIAAGRQKETAKEIRGPIPLARDRTSRETRGTAAPARAAADQRSRQCGRFG